MHNEREFVKFIFVGIIEMNNSDTSFCMTIP